MVKDEGCPTCGSKDYANLGVNKNESGQAVWRKHCYNCKKSWNTESYNNLALVDCF
jgi:transcriptional regulator NrdR family protein